MSSATIAEGLETDDQDRVGANYEKLVKIKQKYDPGDLFHVTRTLTRRDGWTFTAHEHTNFRPDRTGGRTRLRGDLPEEASVVGVAIVVVLMVAIATAAAAVALRRHATHAPIESLAETGSPANSGRASMRPRRLALPRIRP